jgi:hypothetical protein
MDVFSKLLNHISTWHVITPSWISNYRSPRGGWTGTLPAHYGSSRHPKLPWIKATAQFLNNKPEGIANAKEREALDLLVHILWFAKLKLDPELGEKIRIAQ